MWETWVRSLDWEDPLEKGQATYSSILAWRIPWIHPWGHKELDRTERLSLSFYMQTKHKEMCLCILQSPRLKNARKGCFSVSSLGNEKFCLIKSQSWGLSRNERGYYLPICTGIELEIEGDLTSQS